MTEKPDRHGLETPEAQLEAEHRAINDLVTRVEGARDARALVAPLADLRKLLSDHFAHEERPGGLYDRMGVVSAEFRDRVRTLVDEHFRLLSTVRTLEQQSKSGAGGDIVREARSIGASLRQHEKLEQELVEAAKRVHG